MSCPDCAAGEVLPGEPKGSLSIQGAYYSPGSTQGPTKTAIVLLTDVFGLPLKNCKVIADHLCKEVGCDVWAPDMFAGRPILPLSKLNAIGRTGGTPTTCQEWILFWLLRLRYIPAFITSRPSVADVRIAAFIKAIRKEMKYEKIGAVGYCYGGSAAVRLGATDLTDTIVVCHPGKFTIDEAKAIKVPAAWVCAADDYFFSQAFRSEVEALFAGRKGKDDFVDYEMQDYKGTVHGFAIRPELTKPEVKDAYEGSLQQISTWFKKTLAI